MLLITTQKQAMQMIKREVSFCLKILQKDIKGNVKTVIKLIKKHAFKLQ